MKTTHTIAGKFLACAALAVSLLMSSCTDDPIDGGGDQDDNYVVLSGNLSTQRLTADQKYLIRGQVFVKDGQTLTIDPGTVIFGEKSTKGTLIVERGGKIFADGTATNPIVFTSNQNPGDRDKGDWGGLVLLGKAKVNIPEPPAEGIDPPVYYGGDDDNDNTGSLTYVRVEFAGIELTANNETNGITLGGVGRGTKFENIQVSYGGDDGIEWFGGSVNGKNLIVFATWDDCFDIDNGFSGKLQFGLAIRYPSHADQSESNGFEWDTDGQNNLDRDKTTTVASNFTVIGPAIDGNGISGNYRHGADLRRNVAGSIVNSVFVGFPTAFRFNHKSAYDNYVGGSATGIIENNIFYARTAKTAAGSDLTGAGITNGQVETFLSEKNIVQAGTDFQTSAAYTELGINPNLFFGTKLKTDYPKNPNFAVTSGTIATGAKFDENIAAKLDEAEARSTGANEWKFDRTVAFRGAFGATDWTQGWTNFDPINEVY